MRAAILREYDTTPELGEFDDPVPGDGTVVVEVLAAGLNPVDLRKASGQFPLMPKVPLPSVAGWEGVGRLEDGSRVYFVDPPPPNGALAERSLVDPSAVHPVPEGVDDGVAVALGIAGLAGWLALSWSAKLREGETVLVLGATGTVGQIAVQAAKLLGASRVVAAGRNPDGLARAAELGADATVRLDEEGDLPERFREAAGDAGGFDVIVDPLWGEPGVAAMEASKRFTRHVALGQSAGMHAQVSVATVRNKPVTIIGHTNYAIPFEDQRDAYAEMTARAAAGELTADVERLPLSDAAAAWERLRSGPGGSKLVVVPTTAHVGR
jgi:NADPH:quinone reductase-like Zn-dependent oxidoreductase